MNESERGEKIFVIMAGGFIAEQFDEASSGFNINTSTIATIEEIKSEKNLNIEYCEFSLIDSSSADLDYLYELAKVIQRKVNYYNTKGIVIIFGTDTLEILAYFLHRAIIPHNKPIVITGSMRVEHNIDYDGKANVVNSIRQVAHPQCSTYAAGVTVNFAGKIHSPAYIQRDHSFAIDPFSSDRLGFVGMMHINNNVVWLNKATRCGHIPMPQKLEAIPVVYAYPGATENYLDGYIGKFKGLVVIGYGSGNVSDNMYYAIKRVVQNGLKIVLTTNCKFGGISSEYGGIGGNSSLKELGVIMAQDLSAYQAMIVASMCFGNRNIPDGANLENYFSNKMAY